MMDHQAQTVLAELQAAGAPMPADDRAWLAQYRASLEEVVAMQGPAPAVAVIERHVRGAGGHAIPLRLYRPAAAGPRPTLLFLHGGGFVAGSLRSYDIPLRWIALRSGWQVAAVDYRLAPEHPFPAALDDCSAALDHLFDDASLEADQTRIAVGGDSAGGLLATVTAMHARDKGRALALQILLYPNTDLRETWEHASRQAFDGIVIRVAELYRGLDLYLGDMDRSHPDVSPLLQPGLAGLCPVLLVTNEYDPLRDEADAYCGSLRRAGIRVESIRENGMIHTALQRAARIEAGDILIDRVARALAQATPAA